MEGNGHSRRWGLDLGDPRALGGADVAGLPPEPLRARFDELYRQFEPTKLKGTVEQLKPAQIIALSSMIRAQLGAQCAALADPAVNSLFSRCPKGSHVVASVPALWIAPDPRNVLCPGCESTMSEHAAVYQQCPLAKSYHATAVPIKVPELEFFDPPHTVGDATAVPELADIASVVKPKAGEAPRRRDPVGEASAPAGGRAVNAAPVPAPARAAPSAPTPKPSTPGGGGATGDGKRQETPAPRAAAGAAARAAAPASAPKPEAGKYDFKDTKAVTRCLDKIDEPYVEGDDLSALRATLANAYKRLGYDISKCDPHPSKFSKDEDEDESEDNEEEEKDEKKEEDDEKPPTTKRPRRPTPSQSKEELKAAKRKAGGDGDSGRSTSRGRDMGGASGSKPAAGGRGGKAQASSGSQGRQESLEDIGIKLKRSDIVDEATLKESFETKTFLRGFKSAELIERITNHLPTVHAKFPSIDRISGDGRKGLVSLFILIGDHLGWPAIHPGQESYKRFHKIQEQGKLGETFLEAYRVAEELERDEENDDGGAGGEEEEAEEAAAEPAEEAEEEEEVKKKGKGAGKPTGRCEAAPRRRAPPRARINLAQEYAAPAPANPHRKPPAALRAPGTRASAEAAEIERDAPSTPARARRRAGVCGQPRLAGGIAPWRACRSDSQAKTRLPTPAQRGAPFPPPRPATVYNRTTQMPAIAGRPGPSGTMVHSLAAFLA
eukprot:tig00020538_g10389.t1